MNGLLMFEDLGEDKTDIAHTFAGFLSLTLRKIKLYEQIQELAIIDELTKVFVKRHFLKVYSEELKRIKKMGKEACFMMLDLDRFKNYNDTFGHLVGDVILKETARLIKENIREVDLVGRYGGEEFCVFLPDTSLENGIQVGERIRKAIQYHTFHAYDETLKITISIGIACFPHDAKDEMELIDKADLALYYAKRKGRNKVIAYSKIK
jgi:diguanylate cyclase (GGDEF)-like protein